MFDSVLDRGAVPRRRLATGAVVSVLGHAAVLSALLLIRPPPPVQEATRIIPWPVIPMFTPAATPGPAGGGGPRAHGAPSRGPKRHELLAPAAIPQKLDLETVAPPNEVLGEPIGPSDTGDHAVGDGDGDRGGTGTGGDGTCIGRKCDVAGMTAPQLLARGREPEFTREALEARVEGLMTVQCVVALEGRLEQCQVIHSLPFMERAVVEALATRRYSPATLNGRPLAVRYVFQVKLVMPR